MLCSSILLALVAAGHVFVTVHARVISFRRNFLGAGMQPELVAHTIIEVEEEWKAQTALFAQCNATHAVNVSFSECSGVPASFGKSCDTVVNAVVEGSIGNRDKAKEYMADVCSQSIIKDWHKEKCQLLALEISGAMSSDSYQNRLDFTSQKLCDSLFSHFLKEAERNMMEEKAKAEKTRIAEEAKNAVVEGAAGEKVEAAEKAREPVAHLVEAEADRYQRL